MKYRSFVFDSVSVCSIHFINTLKIGTQLKVCDWIKLRCDTGGFAACHSFEQRLQESDKAKRDPANGNRSDPLILARMIKSFELKLLIGYN